VTHRRAIIRGALCGVLLGALIAAVLLTLGLIQNDGEAMELMMILAVPLSFPIGVALLCAGWGDAGSQWITFIAVALPTNLALWGALRGLVRERRGRDDSRPPV
jgi:hypothetical protein